MNTTKKPSIVLCHGIWADASCFNKLLPKLIADGHEVISVQYGLTDFEHDVAAIKRSISRVTNPVVLVGHSYGGATITAAANDKRVVGLVYIAAVAPAPGETVNSQLQKFPSEIFNHVEAADGRVWMLKSGTQHFAGDLSEDEQKIVWATHYAPSTELFDQQKIDVNTWDTKPSWYILCTDDHTVNPDLQRWVSSRMNAKVTELKSSHVPMLSHPDEVADVINQAACGCSEN
jgi:pimeloyl-ACP methyl ester carboxylesterase